MGETRRLLRTVRRAILGKPLIAHPAKPCRDQTAVFPDACRDYIESDGEDDGEDG